MRIQLLVTLLLSFSVSAYAQNKSDSQLQLSDTKPASSAHKKVMITGSKFVSEIQSGDGIKMMHALGYYHAIEDILSAASRICRPDGISTKAALDSLILSIQSDTHADTSPAALMISLHLTQTWPCTKN